MRRSHKSPQSQKVREMNKQAIIAFVQQHAGHVLNPTMQAFKASLGTGPLAEIDNDLAVAYYSSVIAELAAGFIARLVVLVGPEKASEFFPAILHRAHQLADIAEAAETRTGGIPLSGTGQPSGDHTTAAEVRYETHDGRRLLVVPGNKDLN